MLMKKPNVFVYLTLQTTHIPTLAGTKRFCSFVLSAFFPCDTNLNFDPIIGSTSQFVYIHKWPVINKHEEIMLS